MKKLGIIGGMGPAATALLYKMIIDNTPAKSDQEHIPMVILNDCLMPDRTAAILGTEEQRAAVIKKMSEDAQMLKNCGCDTMVVPCNTAHYFVDQISEKCGIRVLHMLRLTAAKAKEMAPNKKVAVLATNGTIQTGIYQKCLSEEGLTAWNPPEDIQKAVMSIIYDKVKAGQKYGPADWKAIDDAVKASGCDCAVLGCTELSVVAKELDLPKFYIDAMEVLAEKCVEEFK